MQRSYYGNSADGWSFYNSSSSPSGLVVYGDWPMYSQSYSTTPYKLSNATSSSISSHSARVDTHKLSSPASDSSGASSTTSASTAASSPPARRPTGVPSAKIEAANDSMGPSAKAARLSTTEQGAMDEAMAAGVSREDYERTRMTVMSVLRDASTSTPATTSQSTTTNNNTGNSRKRASDGGRATSSYAANTRSAGSTSASAYMPNDVDGHSLPLSRNSLKSSTTSTTPSSSSSSLRLKSINTSTNAQWSTSTPSDSGPSTLRTSVSSSQATNEESPNDSPPTSEDGVNAEYNPLSSSSSVKATRKQGKSTRSTRSDKQGNTSRTSQTTPPPVQANQAAGSGSSGSAREEGSESFIAATAAAAALGMLASSPVKAPSATTSYGNYRGQGLHASNLVSSSSSPLHSSRSAAFFQQQHQQYPASTSPVGSTSGSNSLHQPPSHASSGKMSRSGSRTSEGGKSTTPVRTRLEDIALKSSAQVRRTRERLGLGRDQEMMDLDEDARHENYLLRQLPTSDDEVEGVEGDDQMDQTGPYSDVHYDALAVHRGGRPGGLSMAITSDVEGDGELFLPGRLSPASSKTASTGLAPAFSMYDPALVPSLTPSANVSSYNRSSSSSPSRVSPSRSINGENSVNAGSGHRRTTSFDVSRRRGMLDRFMETSSSPKAAQTARFGAVRDTEGDEEMNEMDRSDDVTVQEREVDTQRYDQERDRQYNNYANAAVHSTPMRSGNRRAAVLRSAGNDLPSPLLAQIRMLSEVDYGSPVANAEAQRRHDPAYDSPKTRLSVAIPGSRGSSSDASVAGSARKRKASHDLMSPRQRVQNVAASPSPPPGSSPPPFPIFATQSPRYRRNSPAHTRQYADGRMYDGSGAPSSASKPYPAYNLFVDAPPMRDPVHGSNLMRSLSAQSSANGQSEMSRPMSANSEYSTTQLPITTTKAPHIEAQLRQQAARQHQQQQQLHQSQSSSPHKRSQQKKALSATSSTRSLQMSQDAEATPPPSTTPGFEPMHIQQSQYDADTKPPFSYAALIGQAIFSTPNNRMSLNDIYTYIMTVYPFYKKQDAGWQNSIRHNLSLNECFVKTQRGADEPGKGCLWGILPGAEEQFSNGNFYKKGKVPKSATRPSLTPVSSSDGLVAPPPLKRSQKSTSVISQSETMSVGSADDSFENVSALSSSFASNMSASVGPSAGRQPHYQQSQMPMYEHRQSQLQSEQYPSARYAQHAHQLLYQQPPMSKHTNQAPQHHHQHLRAPMYHAPQNIQAVSREPSSEPYEQDESFDMEDQLDEIAVRESELRKQASSQARQHPVVRHQRVGSGISSLRHSTLPHSDSDPHVDHAPFQPSSDNEESEFLAIEESTPVALSERSISAEPSTMAETVTAPKVSQTSPARRHRKTTSRRMLTSPPIMSSPPTNVFARMSQPYRPLRDTFGGPSPETSAHVAALMSSPPLAGIMPSERNLRRLPPPTPRSVAIEDTVHAGSSIFLPPPNIRPGLVKGTIHFAADAEEEKLSLPPIGMMSPGPSLVSVNTQSPVSSMRASAANRSSSLSPKGFSHPYSSGSGSSTNGTRSPTLGRSRMQSNTDVFKTPDRFGSISGTPRLPGTNKLAHVASTAASKNLQSLQQSTPKMPGSRAMGLSTPGSYYDPYEFSAVLDDEFERMAARQRDAEMGSRSGDRRSLTFPSPLDRTPKWQPWSPW